jgi:hypothetical protein
MIMRPGPVRASAEGKWAEHLLLVDDEMGSGCERRNLHVCRGRFVMVISYEACAGLVLQGEHLRANQMCIPAPHRDSLRRSHVGISVDK